MIMIDYVWLWMIIYDYVPLGMTMYDYVWSCVTIHIYVWLYFTRYVWVWLGMTMYIGESKKERERECARKFLNCCKLFKTNIQSKLFHKFSNFSFFSINLDFVYFWLCLFMFVYLCLPLFTFVYLCLPLFKWRIYAQILCLFSKKNIGVIFCRAHIIIY